MSASILKDSFVIYVLAHLLYAHEVPNRMHQIKPGITIIKPLLGSRYSIEPQPFAQVLVIRIRKVPFVFGSYMLLGEFIFLKIPSLYRQI